MHIHTRLTTAALLGFVLIAASACGGGGGGLSKMEEEALQEQVEAAEEAKREAEEAAAEAERKRKEAEAAAAEEERKRKEAEAEAEEQRQAAEEAEQEAEQEAERRIEEAEQEAERRIEEAETQANVTVRAPLLITKLTGITAADDAGAAMGVAHRREESRTFTRPLNLPAGGSAPSLPGSWGSASYSGPRGNVGTDTVYLYTNIQAPGSKAFWKVHGEEVDSIAAEQATVSGLRTGTSLYLDSNGNPETRDDRSQSGTYDGYPGTFKCASGCNIAAADDGTLTFTGTWTFSASLTATRSSTRAEQDTEFLYFGIWAFEPTDPADATNLHDFDWAAGGAGSISSANFTALEGTATFTGGAIGKYALAKVGGREAQIGTFSATANFTADFNANNLSGRLTDFKEGGSSLGADWNVFLGSSASQAATLAESGATGTLQTHGAIDGDSATGSWAATLYGSDNEDMSSVDGYTVAKYPRADVAGVAGWFNAAAGSNAAIAGSFGAACTTGTMCAR